MRVVHVVTAWPRGPDDLITPWLVTLLGRLRERGVEAEVLAPAYRGGPRPTSEASWLDIPVHRFRYAPAPLERLTHEQTVPDRLGQRPAWGALLPAYLAGGVAAARRLGRERPDLVHVHWPMPHALFGAAARRASGGRTALVCSYYSVELRWVERRLRWLRPFLRWTIRTADAVTAISSPTAGRVRAVGAREATVIPFAAALEGPTAAELGNADGSTEGAESGTGRNDETDVVPLAGDGPLELLFVGRLVERKGVEVLVRALPGVLRERPARLTVVGEGAWEPRIREAARRTGVEERVRFTGRVPPATLRDLYAGCDIFVLPAVVDRKGDTEGLGVVLLEALRFGRPVIGSEIGGIPDIVRHGRTGWLVPPGDSEALAERILAVAAAPEEARRVAEAGRRWAGERFSWERVIEDLLACYRDAIARRSGARPEPLPPNGAGPDPPPPNAAGTG